MATGMLPVCFGEASKFASFGLNANKSYEAVMKLGVMTNTADAEGSIVAKYPVPELTPDHFIEVKNRFVGHSQQVPPMYSALKQNGVPLYELARQGETVERASRAICIHDLHFEMVDAQHVKFQVSFSKGTYVRTLAEDMAKALGCGGAHLVSLRRTSLGYLSAPMISLSQLEEAHRDSKKLDEFLLPMDAMLDALPHVTVNEETSKAILQGKKIFLPDVPLASEATEERLLRFYTESNVFLGIASLDAVNYAHPKRLVSGEYLMAICQN